MTPFREIFCMYVGPDPWPCYECGKPVTHDELNVHHIDEDKTNDAPENLAAVHGDCHTRLHHVGRRKSPESIAKISAAKRGRPGRPHSEATKAKMRASWVRRRERSAA